MTGSGGFPLSSCCQDKMLCYKHANVLNNCACMFLNKLDKHLTSPGCVGSCFFSGVHQRAPLARVSSSSSTSDINHSGPEGEKSEL